MCRYKLADDKYHDEGIYRTNLVGVVVCVCTRINLQCLHPKLLGGFIDWNLKKIQVLPIGPIVLFAIFDRTGHIFGKQMNSLTFLSKN